jgi:hypothetical protein
MVRLHRSRTQGRVEATLFWLLLMMIGVADFADVAIEASLAATELSCHQ